jgi:hypothetical protein
MPVSGSIWYSSVTNTSRETSFSVTWRGVVANLVRDVLEDEIAIAIRKRDLQIRLNEHASSPTGKLLWCRVYRHIE